MKKKFLVMMLLVLLYLMVAHHYLLFLPCLCCVIWIKHEKHELILDVFADRYILSLAGFSYALTDIHIRYTNPYFFCITTSYRQFLVFVDEISPDLHHQLHFLSLQDR